MVLISIPSHPIPSHPIPKPEPRSSFTDAKRGGGRKGKKGRSKTKKKRKNKNKLVSLEKWNMKA